MADKIPKGKKQLWQNKGGGTYYYGTTTILPGEYFRADDKCIPAVFKDTIVTVDEPGVEVEIVQDKKYRIQKRSSGWYDVVDKSGNVVSTQALRHQEAEKVAEKKNAEQ